jgi:hypothetical protein
MAANDFPRKRMICCFSVPGALTALFVMMMIRNYVAIAAIIPGAQAMLRSLATRML